MGQIIALLENAQTSPAKKGPVRLTPLVKPVAKPAAAAPIKAEQSTSNPDYLMGLALGAYKKEEAKPAESAPLAAQPKGPVRLTPTARPTAAQPKSLPVEIQKEPTIAELLLDHARNPQLYRRPAEQPPKNP